MQSKRKSHKIIQLVFVLISVVFLTSEVCAELKLQSVYPTLGLLICFMGASATIALRRMRIRRQV